MPFNDLKTNDVELNRRLSLGNVRCLCVLFFTFVNVIRFLKIVKRHSFLIRWLMYAALCGTSVTRPLHFSQTDSSSVCQQVRNESYRIEKDPKRGTKNKKSRLYHHVTQTNRTRGNLIFSFIIVYYLRTYSTKKV